MGKEGGRRGWWVSMDVRSQEPSGTFHQALTCSFSKSYTRRRPFSLMVSWSIRLACLVCGGSCDDDGKERSRGAEAGRRAGGEEFLFVCGNARLYGTTTTSSCSSCSLSSCQRGLRRGVSECYYYQRRRGNAWKKSQLLLLASPAIAHRRSSPAVTASSPLDFLPPKSKPLLKANNSRNQRIPTPPPRQQARTQGIGP